MPGIYVRMMMRGLKKSLFRFLAIIGVSALGVGFLCGLASTPRDMEKSVDKYYDKYRTYDVNVKSSIGFEKDDLELFAEEFYISAIMPAYVTDALMKLGEEDEVVRIIGAELTDEKGHLVNGFSLVLGRFPEKEDECLILKSGKYSGSVALGKELLFEEDAEGYAAESLTVVGVVECPTYMSVENEISGIGKGIVDKIVFVSEKTYTLPVYTDLFMNVYGAKNENSFGKAYERKLEDALKSLEEFGYEFCDVKYNEIYSAAQNEVDEAFALYESKKKESDESFASVRKELDAQIETLASAREKYQAQLKKYRSELAAAEELKKTLDNAVEEQRALIESQKQFMTYERYMAAIKTLNDQYNTSLDNLQKQYFAPLAVLGAALEAEEKNIDSAQRKIDEAERDYSVALAEAQEEFAKAYAEIQDAQKAVNEIPMPQWYLSDRRDNISYKSYASNTEKIGAISRLFPVFFFAVALLVVSTTMSRMVDEERKRCGLLSSLGYTKTQLAAYYIFYGIAASFSGGLAGALICSVVHPRVIYSVYTMMYELPPFALGFYPDLIGLSLALMCALTVITTLTTLFSHLKERPASLLLPKAQAKGKRIFLERIPSFWKRMSFIGKVSARNVFRYKKRFFMTVTGVAGCMALLITGFGLRDSVKDIVKKQFGEIFRYDLAIYLSEDKGALSELESSLSKIEGVGNAHIFDSTSLEVFSKDGSRTATLLVCKEKGSLEDCIVLKNRRTQNKTDLPKGKVVLSEKLCEELGVSVGDRVWLGVSEGSTVSSEIGAMCENYLLNYVYMDSDTYRELYGKDPVYDTVFVFAGKASVDEIARSVLKSPSVLAVSDSLLLEESFSNTVKSIDSVVLVLIVSAALLALVVLCNLISINISERKKELATMKVLGFKKGELAAYIYREIAILCTFGIFAGMPFGVLLHKFVVKTVEVDSVMFGREVYFESYVISALMCFVFMIFADILSYKRIRDIDMVESMKAND